MLEMVLLALIACREFQETAATISHTTHLPTQPRRCHTLLLPRLLPEVLRRLMSLLLTPLFPPLSVIFQSQTSSLSWLRPWAAWERILFGLLLPLAVLLLIVPALLTPLPPPNASLAGLPLPCGVAMPVFGYIVIRLSLHLSTVLRSDIFHFCCMLCCFVWFWLALYCLVLFVHVVWVFLYLFLAIF